ncbi:MAG: ABC transporter substrate-binding protein [Deltaproteobacteria bacterium]|nr:ABC transporter substrate-binding protein [Deltaproteobacteria bacterium]
MRSCLIAIVVYLASASLSGAGCQRATNEIRIGEYSSLTGNTAVFGQSAHEGILLATEETNAAGGVLSRRIRLITEDDQSKPEEAKTAVLKLIKRHKVAAILGEIASSRSLAAAPECQRQRIPMLTPGSTNPKVTEVGNYIFRSCFIDPVQGGAMATFAFNTLGLRRVAILKDTKNDYSVGLADFFRRAFERLGGTIVAEEAYAEGDIEFRSQLAAIRPQEPEALYLPGYYTEVGLIARQAREMGIAVPLLGGDGWDSEKTIEIGGAAVEGSYFTNHYAPDDPLPAVRKFAERYTTRFGHAPNGISALGYDAARLLFDAISRAGVPEPARIRDALASTKGFPGVAGAITIDANRNASKRIVILRVSNGVFVFASNVELPPEGGSHDRHSASPSHADPARLDGVHPKHQ